MTVTIAIILSSTRPGRRGEAVATWVHEHASQRTDARFELVDLADYTVPSIDAHTAAWSDRIAQLDGYVFVTPEYNHSVPATLKSAIDALHGEWANKAAGFVSYGGSAAGARAVEHLRLILAELQVATVRAQVTLPFATELENGTTFTPGEYQLPFVDALLDQVIAWSGALRPLRTAGA